ncbi:MAG: metal ABC transporter ATP-binding protein [Chlamydiia bacterium]|nr:metal ABC transporter ATP-binding protein [Chlamydiia bacterium]
MLPAISFQNVSFSYQTTCIIKNASFTVDAGEYVGVIGPNGGGKTTALKLMLGFLSPQKGEVKVFGKPPKEERQKVGYVPQINAYDKDFPISVLEVVLMGTLGKLSAWGKYPKGVREKGRALLEMVEVVGLENQPFGSLSGGQAQKVLIARALMSDPDILLLDEPTANVDAHSEEAIFNMLNTLKGKKTILIVTHNFDAIMKNVERVLCFQHEVSSIAPKDVCEHFAMGMYHKAGGHAHG